MADEIRIGTRYVGETPRPMVVSVRLDDGTVPNLTGAAVRLDYRVGAGTPVNRTGAVIDGPGGKIGYTWVAGDFTAAGQFDGVFSYSLAGIKEVAAAVVGTIAIPPAAGGTI